MTDQEILKKVSESLDAEIILHSGDIPAGRQCLDRLIDITRAPSRPNVLYVLCTFGGDAHTAYSMTRRLQAQYEQVYMYVAGFCKSAGTLMAIGSDKLILDEAAELGPIDVQMKDKDELFGSISGLNIDESITALREQTIDFFRANLVDLVTGGNLSTRTSAEIATQLSVGLFSRIISQIDPLRLGETRRAVNIAIAYGNRLIQNNRGNTNIDHLARLVQGYPDHDFVIDSQEARELFFSVRQPSSDEHELHGVFGDLIRWPNNPRSEGLPFIKRYFPIQPTEDQGEQDNNKRSTRGFETGTAAEGKTVDGIVKKDEDVIKIDDHSRSASE